MASTVRLRSDTLMFRVADEKHELGTALITKRGSEYFPRVRRFLSSGQPGRPTELSPTKTVREAKKSIQQFFGKSK
ncbi:hypothetical protein LCGC14_0585210 [marine sediment metagenome]|uniref:Uncharacterized protein n=1 Tax=marine sediment metagenome TaxID=412755 RepID=A0A0F9RK72_9ZZZZ